MTATTTTDTLVHEIAGARVTINSPATMRRDDWVAQRRQLDGIFNGGTVTDQNGPGHIYLDANQALPIWVMLLVSIELDGETFRSIDDLRYVAGGGRRNIHEEIDPAHRSLAANVLVHFAARANAGWLLTAFDKNPSDGAQ